MGGLVEGSGGQAAQMLTAAAAKGLETLGLAQAGSPRTEQSRRAGGRAGAAR